MRSAEHCPAEGWWAAAGSAAVIPEGGLMPSFEGCSASIDAQLNGELRFQVREYALNSSFSPDSRLFEAAEPHPGVGGLQDVVADFPERRRRATW